jgi:regulator of protease activity HflC (stomatin/prohibitin superfamily)
MDREEKAVVNLIVASVTAIIALMAVWSSGTIVGAGQQAVVTRFGEVRGDTLKSGLHWIFPFVDKAHILDIREQKEQVDVDSASKDLQSVTGTIALNYHLEAGKVNDLYREVGLLYKERIIDPSIQESFKSATAKFTAEELITRRTEVKEAAKSLLSERLAERYIVLDDLSIVNFGFSVEFDKAIESKVTAEQRLLEAQYKLETAQKDAQAMKAQADALEQNTQLVEWERLKIQREAITKWNGTMPNVYGGENMLFNIPVN